MSKSRIPSATQSPRFSGIRTFMRLPYEPDSSQWPNTDVAVVGLPFDTAASFRPGARFGPSGIRDISTLLRPSNQFHKMNAFDKLRVVDIGDLTAIPGDIQRTFDNISTAYHDLAAVSVIPLGLGGDHSVSLGELRGLAAHHGPLSLIHFDAHCDTWDNYWGLKYTHGTIFRRACEEGLIIPDRSIQVGMRGTEYDPADLDASRSLGFEVLPTVDIVKMEAEAVARAVKSRVGQNPVFFTFDIDFFDPSQAPGTGTPEVGGLTSLFGLEIVRRLGGLNFVGFDVVEVLPAHDVAQITQLLAATLAFEFVALAALGPPVWNSASATAK